jgi:hypothetical protein
MIEKISGDLFCILPDFHYLCGSKTDDYAERIVILSGRRAVQRAGLCNEEDARR